jgi:hypothetical protein
VHDHLTANNILLDSDHCIQIADFHRIISEVGESESEESKERTLLGGFSGEGWTSEKDTRAFASILFELVFGGPREGEVSIPTGIPSFVSGIMESGFSRIPGTRQTFNTILEILKQNDFEIEEGVDSAEV